MRLWRRRTLRARLTLLSAAGLAVGLAIGGAILIGLLHYSLIHSVDASMRSTASEVSSLLRSGELTDPIPSVSPIVQVIGTDRTTVYEATEYADRSRPILTSTELDAALRGRVITIPGYRAGQTGTKPAGDTQGDLRVIAASTTQGDLDHDRDRGGPRIVIVAESTHAAQESEETVTKALLVVYPLLVGVLSALAWLVVGWTLRPVEVLRRSADLISAGGGSVGQLPVPDGDDEVHKLALTLNDMLDRIEAGRARQRAFVADAAHELRSPISSLRTQLEVAEHLDEPAVTGDLLDDVGRLGHLVDDLLLLARTDEGDPRLRRFAPIDVAALARETVRDYANSRVPVTADAPGEEWTRGEPITLRRVLDNLITNSVRHAASYVRVSVAPATDSAWIHVTVIDDGPGIPAEHRERVFDRFTRLDNARDRDQGGAGLGLAIVRELVRMHGGTITLGDAGPGLVATVELPACAPDLGSEFEPDGERDDSVPGEIPSEAGTPDNHKPFIRDLTV